MQEAEGSRTRVGYTVVVVTTMGTTRPGRNGTPGTPGTQRPLPTPVLNVCSEFK